MVLVINYTPNIVFLMSKPCFNGWAWSFVSTLSEEFMSVFLATASFSSRYFLTDEITS